MFSFYSASVSYYRDCLPIYAKQDNVLKPFEIFDAVLNTDPASQVVCKIKPVGVCDAAIFLVDISKLKHPNDLKADDMGSWIHKGKPVRYFDIDQSLEGEYAMAAKCNKNDGDSVYKLTRIYYHNKSTPEFRKTIFYVHGMYIHIFNFKFTDRCFCFHVDPDGNELPLVVVQYTFLNGEVVPLKSDWHGNCKGKGRASYIRTQHSTLNDIKNAAAIMSPKIAIKTVYDNAGGVINAQSLSEIPRNRRQAVNSRSQGSSTSGITSNMNKDLIYDLLEQNFKSLKTFVRSVTFNDTVACVLASDQQLYDLERFCANDQSHRSSVFGIDPTFNLGDFYVTVTTYENLLITNKITNRHPVFVGPMLIHQRRTYESYFHFAAELVKYRKPLSSLKAIGTDGEEQLSNAFGAVFPGAVRLLCSLHKRDNILTKLRELAVGVNDSKEILNSIFGHQLNHTFFTGLIDADDAPTFMSQLDKIKPRWDAICPGFYQWFLCNEAELFCSYMIRSVRSRANLGFPPPLYTTNNNESINKLLKEKTSYKQQEWPTFNLKMFELVNEQQEEFSKAVCGYGEYKFIDDYHFLEVSQTEWLQMTLDQRKSKVDKAMKFALKKDESATSNLVIGETNTSRLSVNASEANIPHLRLQRITQLWQKAEELLNTPDVILPAAGNKQARQVANVGIVSKGIIPPHFVYSKKSGAPLKFTVIARHIEAHQMCVSTL